VNRIKTSRSTTALREASDTGGKMASQPLEFVFFDIAERLAKGILLPANSSLVASSKRLLKTIRDIVGLRVGVITSLGSLSNAEGRALLEQAGLASFLDPQGSSPSTISTKLLSQVPLSTGRQQRKWCTD
jgi:hypothetical protein